MLKATVIGNLGSDPEMRYSAEGKPFLTFRVASNYRTRTPEGEWLDRTEWVRVRIVGQRAESLSQYLRRGTRVFVDGKLEARPWTNNQGQPQSGLELFANDIEFMSARQDDQDDPQAGRRGDQPRREQNRPAVAGRVPNDPDDDEDLPF